MLKKTDLIDRYKKGDYNLRLYMFLEYRDLRNEFIKIEKTEHADKLHL